MFIPQSPKKIIWFPNILNWAWFTVWVYIFRSIRSRYYIDSCFFFLYGTYKILLLKIKKIETDIGTKWWPEIGYKCFYIAFHFFLGGGGAEDVFGISLCCFLSSAIVLFVWWFRRWRSVWTTRHFSLYFGSLVYYVCTINGAMTNSLRTITTIIFTHIRYSKHV